MQRFSLPVLFTILSWHVVYGARLPEVDGSKLEGEIINSRNPRIIGGVSI